jgi:hypothetical protein
MDCTVCNRSECEPAVHAIWTEFDTEQGIWIEKTSEEFYEQSKLSDLETIDLDHDRGLQDRGPFDSRSY